MPRIGLLSDSHGQAGTTARAVRLLVDQGAQVLIHLGDVGGPAVLEALLAAPPGSDEPVEVHLVFGNTDGDAVSLGRYARALGLHDDHPTGRLVLPEGVLVFTHGHDPAPMRQALEAGVRYLCHGHTHQTRDQRRGATRIINPGALYRARQYTVALLDAARDHLTFYPVEHH